MRIRNWKSMGLIAVLATLGIAGAAQAVDFSFDFDTAAELDSNFGDIRRGNDINQGNDLGGTGHTAANFTGSIGSAGDTWITVYVSGTASGGRIVFGNRVVCVDADILIHRFNNAKGGGVVTLFNVTGETPATVANGLAFLVGDNGNTDRLTLSTVNNKGKLTLLESVALGSKIEENKWYRLQTQTVTTELGTDLEFEAFAQVLPHSDPTDPNSGLGAELGSLSYARYDFSVPPNGLQATGAIGMIAYATSAVVDTSITNFHHVFPCVDPDGD